MRYAFSQGRAGVHKRGFTLLIAVIFMSVVLALGLAMSSLAYKQELLAASVIQSQNAFYSADAALECALYADQQQDLFAYAGYDGTTKGMDCDDVIQSVTQDTPTATQLVSHIQLSLNGGVSCAQVTVYKPNPAVGGTTYIFAEGYSTSCSTINTPNGARIVARGIQYHY